MARRLMTKVLGPQATDLELNGANHFVRCHHPFPVIPHFNHKRAFEPI